MEGMVVRGIEKSEAMPFLLKRHYARRRPAISWAFGLVSVDGDLLGVVTFGPPSSPQGSRICGEQHFGLVSELNRLALLRSAPKNAASFLVAHAIRNLPKPRIVLSFADTGVGHVGYVYQSVGFLYTGAPTAHDGEYELDGKKIHSRTLTSSGVSTAPREWAREVGATYHAPSPKHRYVFFTGSRRQRAEFLSALRYPTLPYPKGATSVSSPTDESLEVQSNLFGERSTPIHKKRAESVGSDTPANHVGEGGANPTSALDLFNKDAA